MSKKVFNMTIIIVNLILRPEIPIELTVRLKNIVRGQL